MKNIEHRAVDHYSESDNSNAVIKEFMEDKRSNIDYLEWKELINLMEVIDTTCSVEITMTHNAWYIKHIYQEFHETFMWHNYRTRQASLHIVIVRFLEWWKKDDRNIISEHYKWLKNKATNKVTL